MSWSSRWLLAVPVVTLGLATGCCRPSEGPAAGGPPGVSSREAVLADMKGLQSEPPEGVVGYVSEWGQAGALVVPVSGGTRVVVGDRAGPVHEAAAEVVFSQDGRHVAYVAREQGRVVVVRDGQAGPPFDEIGPLLWTRDGRHLAYRVLADGKVRLVVDERQGPPLAAIQGEPFLSSKQDEVILAERPAADGRLEVAAWSFGLQRRLVTVVEGGVDAAPSPDGGRLGVVAARQGQQRLLTFALAAPDQRVEGEPFDQIDGIAFDASGAHVAYLGMRGEKGLVVLDGRAEPIPTAHLVVGPTIDARRLTVSVGYVEGDGVQLARFFGATPYRSPRYAQVSELVETADGLHWAHAAERKAGEATEAFVVVNGVESTERFDKVVSPRFSPDGRYLVYRARLEGRRFLVVADAGGKVLRRLAPFEQVFEPSFTPDGAAVAYAVKDGPLLRWKVERLAAP